MAAEEAAASAATLRDPRLDYLGGLVQIVLRCSEEKWLKLLQVEENRIQLTTHFLDDANSECIFVAEVSGGTLALYTSSADLPFAAGKQQKAVFFLKVPGLVATAENVRQIITCGDLFSSTVEQLQAFLDYAVIPTLCNPACHEGWAKEQASDLLNSVRALRSIVARGVAQSKNHVIISVPPIQPFDASTFTRSSSQSVEEAKEAWMQETLSILESSVRHWSEQIQEVLDKELHSGKLYPQPSDYYKFFCLRGKSLRYIRQQLRSESLEIVAEILQSRNSPRDAELKDLIKKVEDGVTEAEDIQKHLFPLHRRCKDLEAKDLPRLRRHLVDGLLRMVREAVEHCHSLQLPHNAVLVSKLYSSASHILVRLSQQFLDGATMFRGELDDSEQRLDLVLGVMDYMRSSRTTGTFLERHDRLEMFVQRLRTIKVIFETSSAFLRLAKTEVGGIHGHATAFQIKQIYDEFQEQLVTFDKCPYDVLEPDAQEFEKDIEQFRRKVKELDGRLGSVIKGCILNCSSLEGMTKVLQVYEFLMKRPAIRDVALPLCERHVREAVRREMDVLLRKFLDDATRDSAAHLPVYKNIPPTSRVIQWVYDIQGQLDAILRSVKNVSHMFISKKSVEAMEAKHEKLSTKFQNFADEIFQNWSNRFSPVVKR
ncbi:Dynein beta chain like protein [Argiope bruennichi]|uniref:Dynein beta chain like protein n=1 Tax=Argiope bruennichi TaxID=94029 RepID=A0A8T0F7P4_ARGBR|nr:Dynein beta chain like protein [Argiope bruennichi]